MTRSETLQIQEAEPVDRTNLVFIRTSQFFWILILVLSLVIGVGLLSYYVPDRSCQSKISDPRTGSTTEMTTAPSPTTPDQVPSKSTTTEVLPKITTTPQDVSTTRGRTTAEPTTIKHFTTEDMMTTTEAPTMGPTSAPYPCRLPTDVVPVAYELFLQPYINEEDVEGTSKERFTFDGRVVITMKCQNKTNRITLNSKEITISDVSLVGPGLPSSFPTVDFDVDNQLVHMDLESGNFLQVGGEYDLTITYAGLLNDQDAGIYRGSYENATGQTSWYVSSQMEATDARRVLPCFDEPDLKATFKTAVQHRSHMVSLTNGIEEEIEDLGDGWTRTSYKQTPIMPTYLLAFTIGEFEYLEANTSNGCRFRTWARPELVHNAEYALKVGVIMQEYFENYFGIDYPLDKQDMIAVTDFAAGAMENWGLIIYRESAMLYDPVVNLASNKRRVALVIAHELAHMWFGDLVSLKWWDHLWLNEGFASFVEFIGMDAAEPDWKSTEQFTVNEMEYVMSIDSSGSSRPIVIPTCTPYEFDRMFDSYSYTKGSAVVRMMRGILSEPVWLDGLHNYLIRFSYGNAETDDLWEELTKADVGHGNLDMKTIMDTWTLQQGYPLITCQRDGNMVKAHQQHYLNDPAGGVDPTHGDLGYLWWVNLQYTDQSEGRRGDTGFGDFDSPKSTWMPATTDIEFALGDEVRAGDWYIVNTYRYGYYRVNYDTDNWQRLANQLYYNHEVFPVENRAQLIDDALLLARRGNISQETALGIVEYMRNEKEYLPWDNIIDHTDYMAAMFRESGGFGDLQAFMRNLVEVLYTDLGWRETPNVLEQYNRNNMIGQACFYRLEDCIKTASSLYKEYRMDPTVNPVNINVRTTVYCTAIREGGEREWEFGWDQLIQTSDSSERSSWVSALACTRQPWLLNQYLWLALDEDSPIRSYFYTALSAVARNDAGVHIAWDFLRNEWDAISALYGDRTSSMATVISSVTNDFNTPQELEELLELGKGRGEIYEHGTFWNAVERTNTNIWWMENNEEVITTWLRTH